MVSHDGRGPLIVWLLNCLLAFLALALGFLLRSLCGSLHGGFGFGQGAGGLRVSLEVTGEMLSEVGIEFLGRSGIGEWCAEYRIVAGFSMGDDIDAKGIVIQLRHCDEHSAGGE